MPEPNRPTHLFAVVKRAFIEHPETGGKPDLKKDIDAFNYVANWMKHIKGVDEIEIEEWIVTMWLNRAVSKYRAVYGVGTPEMAALFPWAGRASNS